MTPERIPQNAGADAEEMQPRCSDEKGHDRRLAPSLIGHGRREAGPDRIEQREPRKCEDHLLGEDREHRGDRRAQQAKDEIEDARANGRNVAFLGVVVRVIAHCDGRNDCSQVYGECSKRGPEQRRESGPGDERRDGWVVSGSTDDGDAWDFCDAIVTMNSGRATPAMAASENVGATKTGRAMARCRPLACSCPPQPQRLPSPLQVRVGSHSAARNGGQAGR